MKHQVVRRVVKPKLIPEIPSHVRSPLVVKTNPTSPIRLISYIAKALRKRPGRANDKSFHTKTYRSKSIVWSVQLSAPTSTKEPRHNVHTKHTHTQERLPRIVLRLPQDGSHFKSGLRLHIHNKQSNIQGITATNQGKGDQQHTLHRKKKKREYYRQVHLIRGGRNSDQRYRGISEYISIPLTPD